MVDDVLEGLLGSVGRGDEELRDPREGEHEPVLSDVRLAENGPQAQMKFAIVFTYSGMQDTEGRDFSFDDRTNVPTTESSDDAKRMFQASLHSFGIVPYEDRRPYFADTDKQRQAFVDAYRTRIGSKVRVKIYIDKNGWQRLRVLRSK